MMEMDMKNGRHRITTVYGSYPKHHQSNVYGVYRSAVFRLFRNNNKHKRVKKESMYYNKIYYGTLL